MHEGIRGLQAVFLLLLVLIVAFAEISRRVRLPYPIVLVLGGLGLSFVPALPKIALNPDLIFVAILPPLLYHAAWQTSWREFRYNLLSICMLAFGLVTFTVAGVALAGERVFSLLYWRTGFVLGAIVAPTDAIAAAAIAKRVGLPQGITDLLEGESLLNDATGLLALEFGIAMVAKGQNPTVLAGVGRLLFLTAVGLGVGLLVGLVVRWFQRSIDNGPIEVTLSFLTPYAAYLAAESAHASGVLAVVACGLYLSRHSSETMSPGVRLQALAVWDALDFVLNGVVFVLIGLQLPFVLAGLRAYSTGTLVRYAAVFSVLLIALRLLWMFPGAYLANKLRRHVLRQQEPMPSAGGIFVVGWTGMRGVVSLAAALSLPLTTADGRPFPGRNLIIFLTFSVILVTLVLQGLTLPPLIRMLGLAGSDDGDTEEAEARRSMLAAALARAQELRAKDGPEFGGVYDDLMEHRRSLLAALPGASRDEGEANSLGRYREVARELLQVERQTAVRLRNQGRIGDGVLRRLERELDLSETRLRAR